MLPSSWKCREHSPLAVAQFVPPLRLHAHSAVVQRENRTRGSSSKLIKCILSFIRASILSFSKRGALSSSAKASDDYA